MSPLRAFFMPFTLFLGAVVFFLIFNPGIMLDIIATIMGLVFGSWIICAFLFIILVVALDRE